MPASRLGRSTPPKSARRFTRRLEVELLEDRWVPSAIRNLPGFTTNIFPVGGSGTTQVFAGGRTDDGSSAAVNVGFTLNFFGVTTNQVFVNCNGNITFNQPFSTFTPTGLNSNNGGVPIIAPYFADVDTRMAGNAVTFGTDTLCGRAAFGVDWFNVDYFDATASGHASKLSTFQLILVDRSDTGAGNFDIEFNYDTITWETGDASGGTNGLGGSSAAVGYSNGTGTPGTFFELTGSHVPGSFLDGGPDALVNTSIMSTTPGRIHFLVRNGQVMTSETGPLNITGALRVFAPLRYITDPGTTIQHGNLTFLDTGGIIVASMMDQCLDEVSNTPVSSFTGPFTVVFTGTPPGTTIVNPTGFTASGLPFITVNAAQLQQGSALRVRIEINNPALTAPTTFFTGFPTVELIAGTFDPTQF
jgi:hypothetical protein